MADYSDYKECTDCVHYELCLHQEKFLIEHNRKDLIRRYGFGLSEPEICCNFRDRSRFVELPYPLKPRDKVWYILEGLGEIDLKNYDIKSGDCAVGNVPDTVIEVGTWGFWVNQLSERNEDYLVPDDCDFISWGEIGKTYFLTKEAAEQALKEREGGA